MLLKLSESLFKSALEDTPLMLPARRLFLLPLRFRLLLRLRLFRFFNVPLREGVVDNGSPSMWSPIAEYGCDACARREVEPGWPCDALLKSAALAER